MVTLKLSTTGAFRPDNGAILPQCFRPGLEQTCHKWGEMPSILQPGRSSSEELLQPGRTKTVGSECPMHALLRHQTGQLSRDFPGSCATGGAKCLPF